MKNFLDRLRTRHQRVEQLLRADARNFRRQPPAVHQERVLARLERDASAVPLPVTGPGGLTRPGSLAAAAALLALALPLALHWTRTDPGPEVTTEELAATTRLLSPVPRLIQLAPPTAALTSDLVDAPLFAQASLLLADAERVAACVVRGLPAPLRPSAIARGDG